ncbi:MAG: KEOPS complex subunit Pcc1 [Candidatus Bathyarchaeia archaeon]|nr:hypothetical protein [Candidatus Bathyarchaeota archaeon]
MLRAEFRFLYANAKEAKSVAQAIEPDNLQAPEGLNITSLTKGSHLLGSISCKMSIETLASTLDDLLACISAAEGAFEALQDQ